MNIWNLIETQPMSGYDNMQFDLEMLERYISSDIKPSLRFYSWKPVTLSIGRNQDISEINLEQCKSLNIDVVKRPTGGKAVLHQGEITYSFTAGKKDGFSNDIFDSYIQISKAIILGLEQFSKEINFSIGDQPANTYATKSFCFSSSTVSDINYLGKKIVGSAQFRKTNNFLQHGSILIEQDFDILQNLFFKDIEINSLINLSEIIGFIPDYNQIKSCIIKAFEQYFSINFDNINSED